MMRVALRKEVDVVLAEASIGSDAIKKTLPVCSTA
jgi:hypothetical protein